MRTSIRPQSPCSTSRLRRLWFIVAACVALRNLVIVIFLPGCLGSGVPAYPRVFIVPMPLDYNRGLLGCPLFHILTKRCGSAKFDKCEKVRFLYPPWFLKGEEDSVRYQQTKTSHPFATTSSYTEYGKTLTYTPLHPFTSEGEFDADVYFHTMMEGYRNRVDDPHLADLFYVPIYFTHRWRCHPSADSESEYKEYEKKAVGIMAEWIHRFPPREGRGPNFFFVSGEVCSCQDPPCNPFKNHRPELAKRIQVGAWEAPPPSDRAGPHVTMPYMSQLHGADWDVTETRPILVLAIMGERFRCAGCGLCHANNDCKTDANCTPGCANVRNTLMEQLQQSKDASDILLWSRATDSDPSNWDPISYAWDPSKPRIYARMLSSTFCLQPPGDTLSRKSFYESILTGCIPVVHRNDDDFIAQLPFSSTIPYLEIILYVPEKCALLGDCGEGTNNTITGLIRQIPRKEITRRRVALKKWGRQLAFSTHNGTVGGYNDLSNPDAFASTLLEVWRNTPEKPPPDPPAPVYCHTALVYCIAASLLMIATLPKVSSSEKTR